MQIFGKISSTLQSIKKAFHLENLVRLLLGTLPLLSSILKLVEDTRHTAGGER